MSAFVLPLKGLQFVLMVQLIDASVSFNISGDLFGLTVVDLFDLSEMPHVHFVPHFASHDVARR